MAVITKCDLSEATEFSWEAAEENIQAVRPGMEFLRLSAKTGEGMDRYVDFLEAIRHQRASETVA